MNTQMKLENLVQEYVQGLNSYNIHNASVIVMDNKTQHVIVYIGSADFKDKTDGGQVNGAAAVREPGSALKPLMYGLCIDNGVLTPKSVMTDVPININGFQPENYDQQFNGFVTMEYALENSLNIPAVKALHELGTDKLVHTLEDCDFRQIRKDEKKLGLSMILGGCGVTLEEMTGMYGALANGGLYVRPEYYALSRQDLTKSNPAHQGKQILSPSADFMITEILSKVTRPDLPVSWSSSMHLPRIAWKTGTSYGKRDAWSIGYNMKYTVGVWVGNFSGLGVPELSGANVATPLLFKIFNTLDYNSTNEWYSMPKACGLRLVCSETGKVPNDFCTNTVMDYFIPLVSNSEKCMNMREVDVSADEKISYCKNCLPDAGYKKKMYKVVPPDMQTYFDDNRIAYEKIPPHNPQCDRISTEGGPAIRLPKNGTEYFIDKKDPQPLQLSCEVSGDVKSVYWYINNKFYKKSDAHKKEFFNPEDVRVKISCTDDKGRNNDIWIKVKYVNL